MQSLIDPSTHTISSCRPLSFSNVSKQLSSSYLCSLSQIEAAVEQTLMLSPPCVLRNVLEIWVSIVLPFQTHLVGHHRVSVASHL